MQNFLIGGRYNLWGYGVVVWDCWCSDIHVLNLLNSMEIVLSFWDNESSSTILSFYSFHTPILVPLISYFKVSKLLTMFYYMISYYFVHQVSNMDSENETRPLLPSFEGESWRSRTRKRCMRIPSEITITGIILG